MHGFALAFLGLGLGEKRTGLDSRQKSERSSVPEIESGPLIFASYFRNKADNRGRIDQ